MTYEYGILRVIDRAYGRDYEFRAENVRLDWEDKNLMSILNELGALGWQLVSKEGQDYIMMMGY